MASLDELKSAFSSFRRRSKKSPNQIRYPKELRNAVGLFLSENPTVQRKFMASELGVTRESVERWWQSVIGSELNSGVGAPVEFVPVNLVQDVEDSQSKLSSGEILISNDSISIRIRREIEVRKIEKLITLLIAG